MYVPETRSTCPRRWRWPPSAWPVSCYGSLPSAQTPYLALYRAGGHSPSRTTSLGACADSRLRMLTASPFRPSGGFCTTASVIADPEATADRSADVRSTVRQAAALPDTCVVPSTAPSAGRLFHVVVRSSN